MKLKNIIGFFRSHISPDIFVFRINRSKIRRAEVLSLHPPIIEEEYRVPSRSWAEMSHKIYDPFFDPDQT